MRDCESCKNHTDKGCTKWKCEFEPTTKNDLVVDWENYKDVDGNSLDDLILEVLQNNFDCGNTYGYKVADKIIELLPSVTPQEPQTFKWCETCKEYDQEKHCCHRWSKVIRDTVEEMKQEQEPRWIPTSERLPENKTYILVTIGIPGRQPHARSGWYQDGFFHNDNGDCWRATDIEVKAWMPLPTPYEPQESEDKE